MSSWNPYIQQALAREKQFGGYVEPPINNARTIAPPNTWMDALNQQNTVIQTTRAPLPFAQQSNPGVLPDMHGYVAPHIESFVRGKQSFVSTNQELTPELVLLFILIILVVVAIKAIYNIERTIASFYRDFAVHASRAESRGDVSPRA